MKWNRMEFNTTCIVVFNLYSDFQCEDNAWCTHSESYSFSSHSLPLIHTLPHSISRVSASSSVSQVRESIDQTAPENSIDIVTNEKVTTEGRGHAFSVPFSLSACPSTCHNFIQLFSVCITAFLSP